LRTLLWSNTRQCPYFACLNPHAVELAAADPDFESASTGELLARIYSWA
jgi:hypothetical protein